MAAFGIKAIQPQDNEHIFGFATARGTADMALLEVWNGPTQSDLRFTIDKEGQLQGRDGSAARPTYSFETDKDTGRYLSGAASMLDVVSGTAVGTWTAGKLTLVELQVDNININGNTISSTAGTDLLITPLAGQQIVLDGTIIIDAGVVTGATAITSSSFVGALTGNADSATTATTATNVTASANNSSDETVYPTFVDGATGAQGIETDTGLTYNPSTGVLTATTFTGAMSGTAAAATAVTVTDNESTNENNLITFVADAATGTGNHGLEMDGHLHYNPSTGTVTATTFSGALSGTATLATTVTITDNESTNQDNALIFTAGGDVDGGNLGLESDGTLTYNPSTGKITATGFIGALTGDASGTAGVATTVTITDNESANENNGLVFTSGGTLTGNLGLESDGTVTYNPSTGKITATGFIGALTGDASGSSGSCTGNSATATTSAHVTVTDNESTNENNLIPFVEDAADSTGSHGLEMDGDFHYNPSTGTVTATAFTGTATVATKATTVVVTDSTDTSSYIAMFNAAGDGSTAQSARTDAGLTYNASSGVLTATGFAGPITGNVTGNASGNAATATALETARTIGGTSFNGTANIVPATITVADTSDTSCSVALFESATGDLAPKSDAGITYNAGTGTLTATAFAGPLTGNVTGNTSGSSGSTTGNAATATALATARAINGVDFDGTGAITVTAAAGTLSGGTLASGVTASSLPSVGTLTSLTTSGDIVIDATDKIRLDGSASGNTYIREGAADTITFTTEGTDNFAFASDGGNPSIQILANAGGATGTVEYSEGGTQFWQHGVRGTDEKWYLTGDGTLHSNHALMIDGRDVDVGGELTATTKTFRIDHPLTDMADTHTLTHACIEGPRADLVYRDSVVLSGGSASVDLDESAGMSDGTWEALCRDPQVFLQNDTSWSAVKGSVSGSTLIISCEDTNSTDTISWMVVSERDDPTYHSSTTTDSDGSLIIEAEKPEEDE